MSAICPSTTALILGAIIFWCLYWLTVFIYRVYLSPLSHIPGPKLAAATFWYEFYYEIYPNQFQYLWKIQALNNQYGPIVRINPLHVHIHDHDYYTTIYASGHRKRNRCSWYMHSGAKAMNGIVDVIDHDFHKRKRQAMEPFFSKRSVQGLESQIVDKVEKLLSRLSSALSECEDNDTSEKGTIVNLSDAMCALALDIVSEYAFGEPYGALDRDDYARDFVRILREGMQMRVLGRQFPWLVNTLLDLPSWIAIRINKNMADISMWFEDMTRMIDAVRAEKTDATSTKSHSNLKRTVFHEYLDKELPEDEKATSALLGTGANLIGAGTETTARNLAVTIYYLLQNKDMLEQLRRELKIAIPVRNSRASLADLEKLPYLSAIINEGLRCAHGVSARQPRVPTEEDLQYKQYKIPRGTPVMESLYLLNTDPAVFPDPLKFRPQRWLENPKLTKYQFAFSKGSMSCLGMNLATAELYLTIAHLMRWMEMKVYDTSEARDVLTTNDVFIGMADLGSTGIKVKILGKVEH